MPSSRPSRNVSCNTSFAGCKPGGICMYSYASRTACVHEQRTEQHLGGGGAVGLGVSEEAVVQVSNARREVALEPGVALHVGQADAGGRVRHQDLPQQVAALRRHHRMRRQRVLHVQDPLRTTCAWVSSKVGKAVWQFMHVTNMRVLDVNKALHGLS